MVVVPRLKQQAIDRAREMEWARLKRQSEANAEEIKRQQ